ncbi:conjugative transposon protein TraN [Dyadobacter frigoris]|nr:conjugative transposon protein TraN [Dyadobacter frigoris]
MAQVINKPSQAQSDSLIPNSVSKKSILKPIVIDPHPFVLPIAKASVRGSYPIELAFNKTTHIVFPSKIKDFDAGSAVVIATVPETVLNVLRVKSDVKGFVEETNMTVLTEDGGLYSFLVRYNENPAVFNINISNNIIADYEATKALGIGASSNSSPNTYVLADGNYVEEALKVSSQKVIDKKSFIRHVGAKKDNFEALVKGLYLDNNNLLFMKLQLKNKSYMPYKIDFIKVFVRDKNYVKRMAVQEEEITTLMSYPIAPDQLNGYSDIEKVISFPYYTLADGKVLEIEVYEKAGGRHVKFQLDNQTLLQVKNL